MRFLIRNVLLLATLAVCLALVSRADACGASAGSGGVAVCSVDDIREKARKKWHLGASYGYSATKLVLSGGELEDKQVVKQRRQAVVGVAEWRMSPRWSFQVGAGGLIAGELSDLGPISSSPEAMKPGFVGMIGSSFVAARGQGAKPFLLFTAQFSSVFSGTDLGSYQAYDLRLGGALGWTFFNQLSPYATARVFGGPIDWQLDGGAVSGTDRYHYQIGGGLSWLIAYKVDLFVEGIALGERGVVAGAGFAF